LAVAERGVGSDTPCEAGLARGGVTVKSWNRWAAILLAVAGTGVCLIALVGFLATVTQNNLPWQADQSIREHYLAVGESYSQGFTVGFFLCFFLTLIAVSVKSWLEQRGRSGKPVARRATPRHPVLSR